MLLGRQFLKPRRVILNWVSRNDRDFHFFGMADETSMTDDRRRTGYGRPMTADGFFGRFPASFPVVCRPSISPVDFSSSIFFRCRCCIFGIANTKPRKNP